ncbi:hypothetical protein WMF46_26545 [Sorangium sp. So ce117]
MPAKDTSTSFSGMSALKTYAFPLSFTSKSGVNRASRADRAMT